MNQTLGEVWKDIPGFNGDYQASSEGRIRSFLVNGGWKRPGGPKIAALRICPTTGYPRIIIKGKDYSFHHLISLTFHGPKPAGFQVRHLDGNRRNSRPDNLKYGTRSENGFDMVRHGRGQHGTDIKLSAAIAQEIRKIRAETGTNYKTLGRRFKVCPTTIGQIVRGETWK